MNKAIPGGMSASQFLRDYWQKKPLLIRQAFHNFSGLLTKQQLIAFACQPEAQSKLIQLTTPKPTVSHGPFCKKDFAKLSEKWTVLVQDVNHFIASAQTLLQHFDFIPNARLDDLMVSFANDGSGVGPHVDSYDVFLLQGSGQRLWQIAEQPDVSFVDNMPLQLLKNFKAEQQWLLEPGDMLYLPPNCAHNGIAVGDSMTYSIGFRAPDHQHLAHEFLNFLQDRLTLSGIYTDPDLTLNKHPALISKQMLSKMTTIIQQIRFDKQDIEHFVGQYLTEPKAHIFYAPPTSPLTKHAFLKQAKQNGIHLDLKTQMLFSDKIFYINGESFICQPAMQPILRQLADERKITLVQNIDKDTAEALYNWYVAGYLNSHLITQ